ncbi:hypothetical protein CRENBAI_002270 [Crenichthys baileyi]|uniref:Uncharacterized protein n=1 Tax=Crenichthys baileyi TaxID=28760 RepID=A0AAV9S206_9TELE
MYTVYCYAYYFTIKERQQWTVCYYQGWNFKEHLHWLRAVVFTAAPIGLKEECLHFVSGKTRTELQPFGGDQRSECYLRTFRAPDSKDSGLGFKMLSNGKRNVHP